MGFQQHQDASCHQVSFFLQGKAPKDINAILTETLAYFLPGRAKDLSAPLYFHPFLPQGVNILSDPLLVISINPLNAKLNPICHLLALLGARHIIHVSRIRVNTVIVVVFRRPNYMFLRNYIFISEEHKTN